MCQSFVMINPCHLYIFLIYVLKFVLTTTLSRHICLFKVSIIIINSYLLCCSLLIQVHFKAQFFWFNYASSPHVHNDVVYMSRNIWIFFWCGSIVGHAKEYLIHIKWTCQKIFLKILLKKSIFVHIHLFTKYHPWSCMVFINGLFHFHSKHVSCNRSK